MQKELHENLVELHKVRIDNEIIHHLSYQEQVYRLNTLKRELPRVKNKHKLKVE